VYGTGTDWDSVLHFTQTAQQALGMAHADVWKDTMKE
jgi:hypothetical protein